MILVLRKFCNRYDKPSATELMIDDWYELFPRYDTKNILEAANRICLESKFFPKPPDLNKAYWQVHNEIKDANRKLAIAETANKDCKYCNGTGWFMTIYQNQFGRDESYACECVCKNGKNSNINAALASDEFTWSDKDKAFVPRGWVGDKEPVGQADIDFNKLSSGVKSL